MNFLEELDNTLWGLKDTFTLMEAKRRPRRTTTRPRRTTRPIKDGDSDEDRLLAWLDDPTVGRFKKLYLSFDKDAKSEDRRRNHEKGTAQRMVQTERQRPGRSGQNRRRNGKTDCSNR